MQIDDSLRFEQASLFIEALLDKGCLKLGDFRTKSGRSSPFFCDLGMLEKASDLKTITEFYRFLIEPALAHFSGPLTVLGPAYKGIPLALMLSSALEATYQNGEVFYSVLRKEAKDHGEKGLYLGKKITPGTPVILVDDVLTSGLSIDQTLQKIEQDGGQVLGILVGLDRSERHFQHKDQSAKDVLDQKGFNVYSVACIHDLLSLFQKKSFLIERKISSDWVKKVNNYVDQYCIY